MPRSWLVVSGLQRSRELLPSQGQNPEVRREPWYPPPWPMPVTMATPPTPLFIRPSSGVPNTVKGHRGNILGSVNHRPMVPRSCFHFLHFKNAKGIASSPGRSASGRRGPPCAFTCPPVLPWPGPCASCQPPASQDEGPVAARSGPADQSYPQHRVRRRTLPGFTQCPTRPRV